MRSSESENGGVWDHTKHPKPLPCSCPISVQLALASTTSIDMGKWGRWAPCCFRNSPFTCSLIVTAWSTVSTWAQGLVSHWSINPVQEVGKRLVGLANDIQSSPTVCVTLSLPWQLSFWHEDAESPWHSAASLVERRTSGVASCSNLQRLNEIYRLRKLDWPDNEIFIVILPLFFEVQNSLSSLGWSLHAWEEFTIKPVVFCYHLPMTSTCSRQKASDHICIHADGFLPVKQECPWDKRKQSKNSFCDHLSLVLGVWNIFFNGWKQRQIIRHLNISSNQ